MKKKISVWRVLTNLFMWAVVANLAIILYLNHLQSLRVELAEERVEILEGYFQDEQSTQNKMLRLLTEQSVRDNNRIRNLEESLSTLKD